MVVLIIIFLLLSALFSGSEIAFVSANKLRVELKKKRGTYRSAILANWFDQPAKFLSTMLVGNNIALVAFSTLMTKVLDISFVPFLRLENELLIILANTMVITLVVLIFGEFIPKALFRLFSDDALYFFAIPLRLLQLLVYLPSMLMTNTSEWILSFFFKRSSEALDNVLTRTDLENFVNESQSSEEEAIDTELFGKALNLHDVRVRDCMIPRTEIQTVDINASLEELTDRFRETRLSRLLLVDGDVDNVQGYVHHQSLLSHPKDIEACILPITFVPEVTRVTDMLDTAVKAKVSIACVVDEFGAVSGIITMEDLLEQIFGEIEDEYDEDDYVEVKIDDDTYEFSGRLEVNYLRDKYGLKIPEGDYQTLSGYLVTAAERVPEQDESLEMDGFRFEMLDVTNTRIETLRVIRLNGEHL
ncbi:MAG: hemolysin family protein [Bacteroidota bacterium]